MARVCAAVLGLVLLGAAWAEEPAKEPPVPVQQLFETFRNNEARAEKLYVGKEIDVVGIMFRVMKNRETAEAKEEEYFIGLVTVKDGVPPLRVPAEAIGAGRLGNPFTRGSMAMVKCYFSRKEINNLAGLSEGQEVVVRGVCEPLQAREIRAGFPPDEARTVPDYQVVLRNCKIVRVKELPERP